jgi:hypothetical protein
MQPDTRQPAVEERFVEVDAARLLLVLAEFAIPPTAETQGLRCWPQRREVARVLAPEYYLQKLDFLVRNPTYLAYEMIELHNLGVSGAADADVVKADVRTLIRDREPEQRTDPYRRFWRGAYENIDRVEAWWYARGLVFTGFERRGQPGGGARPWKYFFLSPKGEGEAARLVGHVEPARWYAEQIRLIYRYFGSLSPAHLKELQYSHEPYRQAQLNEIIPDLTHEQISQNFTRVFAEAMET